MKGMLLQIKYIQILIIMTFLSGCNSAISEHIENRVAETTPETKDDSDIQAIIKNNEIKFDIPKGILKSIAIVESGVNPYAVNSRRKSHLFKSKNEALKFINSSVKKKNQNLSVGCMQIHYKSHRHDFNSVEDMLSPEKNTAYAAAMLKKLYTKYGNWEKAIKKYHTSNPKYSNAYYKKVMKAYNSKLAYH